MLWEYHRLRVVYVLFAVCGMLPWARCVGAEEAKAEAKPAPAAAAAKSPTEQFAAKLQEWNAVLKELRALKAKHGQAAEPEVAQIRAQWDQWFAKGEALIPELRTAGMAAYAAAPQQDRQLERFLVSMLKDDITHDRYEEAAALSKALLDNGCDIKEVNEAAGVAAFVTNDYDRAEVCLKKAKEDGSLSEKGREYLGVLGEYKGYWEKEKVIRAQEAKDDNLPRVRITTTKGDIVIELFENEAPDTVANFISLVEKGFYNGLSFHRVLPQFMAQGGCPIGDGTGGPGYSIYCECYKDNYRRHFRGTLSMAHVGRNTGGSQFFLTFVPTPHLNGKHTAFGRVIEGMDVLAKIQRIDPEAKATKPEPDKIVKMEVLRKRQHEYKPNKVQ